MGLGVKVVSDKLKFLFDFTNRLAGFNWVEWFWILFILWTNYQFSKVVYGGELGVQIAVALINTVIFGVLPVLLLRGIVGAFRKLRRHIASR